MKIKTDQGDDYLSFYFIADELDSVLSNDEVWFKFDRKVTLCSPRVALLAYILCSEVIGNLFSLEGSFIPSYLSSVIARGFSGHEIFIEGISNTPTRILPPVNYSKIITFKDRPTKITDTNYILVKRSPLGYKFINNKDEVLLSVSTNMDFHISLCCSNPKFIEGIASFLIAFDSLGVKDLAISEKNLDLQENYLIDCVKEIGGNVIQYSCNY